jgi:hypothetical protein
MRSSRDLGHLRDLCCAPVLNVLQYACAPVLTDSAHLTRAFAMILTVVLYTEMAAATSAAVASASAAPSAAPSSTPPPAAAPEPTCVEHIPEGKSRPPLSEQFPSKGKSGFTAWLEVTLEHGKGENVLPGGFQVQHGSDDAKAIERAQFMLPDPSSATTARVTSQEQGARVVTKISIPFVPLPKKPGRQELTLPSVPIALARASGDLITLCTTTHVISIEDPTANDPQAKPKKNPPAERQLEEWTLLKQLSYAGVAALGAALFGFLLARWWSKRTRKLPPPPPPRPPWEVAVESLQRIRRETWIADQRYDFHFDQVSDVVRRYLGAMFGFDGLESTTREALAQLESKLPPGELLEEIKVFLKKADLVKFARLTPTEAECHGALEQGERFVQRTMPTLKIPDPAVPSDPAGPIDPGTDPARPSSGSSDQGDAA